MTCELFSLARKKINTMRLPFDPNYVFHQSVHRVDLPMDNLFPFLHVENRLPLLHEGDSVLGMFPFLIQRDTDSLNESLRLLRLDIRDRELASLNRDDTRI